MFIFKQLSNLLTICQPFNTKISPVKLIYNIDINYSKHVPTWSIEKSTYPAKANKQKTPSHPRLIKSIQNLYMFTDIFDLYLE